MAIFTSIGVGLAATFFAGSTFAATIFTPVAGVSYGV